MKNIKLAAWSLRVGLAFVFIYASIEMYIHPANFLKYTPSFIFNIVPVKLFLHSFGIAELLLAIWLLTKRSSKYSSLLSIFLMVGIVVFNMEHFNVLFRNVAIAFGAVALLFLETDQDVTLKTKQTICN